jgi:hypothetical protein
MQGHAESMSGRGSAMRGNATTSQNAERRGHIKRMSCGGGATRGSATTSWRVERWQCIETKIGAMQ